MNPDPQPSRSPSQHQAQRAAGASSCDARRDHRRRRGDRHDVDGKRRRTGHRGQEQGRSVPTWSSSPRPYTQADGAPAWVRCTPSPIRSRRDPATSPASQRRPASSAARRRIVIGSRTGRPRSTARPRVPRRARLGVDRSRYITDAELRAAATVIILGATTARELFGDGSGHGQQLRVMNVPVTVVRPDGVERPALLRLGPGRHRDRAGPDRLARGCSWQMTVPDNLKRIRSRSMRPWR